MSSDKIKVAVRVRPFNRREIDLNTQCVVEMDSHQTVLQYPISPHDKIDRKQPKTFAFDHCFESLDPSSPNYSSQAKVFDCLGTDILDNAFEGYNACIFAYGQTGSGKSYTMMGSGDAAPGASGSLGARAEGAGVIPRLCDALFERIALAQQPPALTYKVEVSYMEIYNERVHDLLDPDTHKRSLRVREHNVLGPYVDGLSQLAVTAYHDIDNLMAEGNKSRTVAATNMNSESSRSHAVFSVVLTQTLVDIATGVTGEKVSRLSLVDLAGSERAVKTGAVGDRLKEGSNINKSLTTLGLVISKLADQSSGKTNKDKFVPYRDSVLTWLLKDNLGGNSKTVMVATISPAADNYEETLSTLRYADRAKRIVNHAVVNEDPNARIIRELRQEVEALKEMLKHATGSPIDSNRVDIHEKLAQSENLMKEMSQTWEEKLVKTGRIQSERQQALEKMGISVQASGIKVEKNKYYLVNLNADPSLNELLVYYLKERTLVGNREFTTSQPDIQLSGLGIQSEHCLLLIEDGGLYMEPLPGARCFVNGSEVTEKICLEHGDRILWGNHHFFRVNCPKALFSTSEPQTPAQPIDYNFARDEIMLNKLSNDPIQTAISRLEKQHEEDKQVALEKQRQEYERQFQQLRNILSPSTPYPPYSYDPLRIGKLTPCTPTTAMRVERWAAERDDTFRRSLAQLKADILRANAGVQEANTLARETKRRTKYSVTLQIPPQNLSPNRKRGAFVSEPAILVRRPGRPGQVWSMEKLENKLVDMRELYNEFCQRREILRAAGECADIEDDEELQEEKVIDPFYESQENHNLIGVANIFLEALFHDVTLDYHTPIISQQGEVAGRLQVEISRIAGQFPQDRICEAASDSSGDARDDDDSPDTSTQQVTCRVLIKQASGLPPSLSHFVFCQYSFWGGHEPIVVPPMVNADVPVSVPHNHQYYKPGHVHLPGSPRHLAQQPHMQFQFDHQKDFVIPISEEFLEHCSEGALSIEVWGHRSAGWGRTGSGNGSVTGGAKGWVDTGEEVRQRQLAKARSLADRWAELTRKIELWVEIHELNDQGDYAPVEVLTKTDMLTGGVYQLRQGQQRRMQVRVKPAPSSGTLPIVCQHITSIEVGSVSVRSRLQKPLDSYQEEDLAVLRERWSDALARRRQHLHAQLQRLVNMSPTTKSERDMEREQSLVEQWVSLTEERNAVLVPSPGSLIPGAPAAWSPPSGMEHHIPVLFLDLNADDMTTHLSGEEVSGLNSILPKEHGNKFYELLILQHDDHEVSAIAGWDSSIHDSQYLNRITEANERVYLILKTTVRLSHPVPMDLVLRKRLGLNIYKKQSLTERIRKRIARSDALTQTGVTYEVVSNIPKASEELEERESLAQIAATGEEASFADGETYIEKYTRGVSAVESILSLDRLRQSVAVRELEQARQHPNHSNTQAMRKTASVPNFSQIMRLDASLESLIGVGRSESVTDLNNTGTGGSSSNGNSRAPLRQGRHSYGGETDISSPSKPFGLASPAGGKLGGLRMTTLHEEPGRCSENSIGRTKYSSLVEEEDDSHSDSETVPHINVTQPLSRARGMARGFLSSSKTLDSLHELASDRVPAKNSPSITSSGYGSQAVSSTNLTLDDALSIRSMSVDETPDLDLKNDSSQSNKIRQPTLGVRNDVLESRTDPNDNLTGKPSTRLSAITPGSKRINPFLRDCEMEFSNPKDDEVDRKKSNGGECQSLEPQYFDPLGALPVQNNVITSSSQYQRLHAESSQQQKLSNSINGDAGQDVEVESVTSDISNPDSGADVRSNDVSSTGGDYDSPYEGNSVVRTQLPPGKIVRRRKPTQTNSSKSNSTNRASFPQAKSRPGDLKTSQQLEHQMAGLDMECSSSSERILDDELMDRSSNGVRELPPWCIIGESVQVRLTSCTGIIAYIGPTEFASGVWVGVDLDTPTGKNDGTVNGKQYFLCRPRHGIFVRPEKLAADRRGRALRQYQNAASTSPPQSATLRRAGSRGEGLSNLHRSRSRGESINAVGNRNNSRPKY